MNKKNGLILAAFALAFAVSGCAGGTENSTSALYSDTPWQGSGSVSVSSDSKGDSSVSEKTLTGIKVASQPAKTVYVEGERFLPDGMLIEADYSDGTNEDVFDYTYDLDRALKTSDTKIVVSYKGFSVDVTLSVKALQKFEAENYSSQSGQLAVRAEAAAIGTFSGTGYLGAWDSKPDRWVEFDIDSDKAAKAEFYCCLDCPESAAKDWNSRFSVLINGAKWEASDDAIYVLDNPGWFHWDNVDLGSIDLIAGTNTIKITEINAITNMDYIGFLSDATLALH